MMRNTTFTAFRSFDIANATVILSKLKNPEAAFASED